MGGEMGERLRAMLEPTPPDLADIVKYKHKIKLLGDGSCPMLTEDGWCDLYAKCGPEAQCRVCRDYPRAPLIRDDYIFYRCTLTCPEVVRMLLSCRDKAKIVQPVGSAVYDLNAPGSQGIKLELQGLSATITILQHRNIDISSRLKLAVLFNAMYEAHIKDGQPVEDILQMFSNEDEAVKLARSLQASSGWNAAGLVKFLTEVLGQMLYLPNSQSFANMCDEASSYIYLLSENGQELDIRRLYEVIKKSAYELQFEQYLAYYAYDHYVEIVTADSYLPFAKALVCMYVLISGIEALLVGKKGKTLTQVERIGVIYKTSRAFDNNKKWMRTITDTFDETVGSDIENIIGAIL